MYTLSFKLFFFIYCLFYLYEKNYFAGILQQNNNMAKHFFQNLLKNSYEALKEKPVYDVLFNCLRQIDPIAFNLFIGGYQYWIKQCKYKERDDDLHEDLLIEVDAIEKLLLYLPKHVALLNGTVEEVDEQLTTNQFLDLASSKKYSIPPDFFKSFEYIKIQVKAKHHKDLYTASDILEVLRSYLTDAEPIEESLEIEYSPRTRSKYVMTLLVFLGIQKKLQIHLKKVVTELEKSNPTLLNRKNEKIARASNSPNALTSTNQWADKPVSDFLLNFINKRYLKEVSYFKKITTHNKNEFERTLKFSSLADKIKKIKRKIAEIEDQLYSESYQGAVSLFHLSMDDFAKTKREETEIAFEISHVEDYFFSEETIQSVQGEAKLYSLFDEVINLNGTIEEGEEQLSFLGKSLLNPYLKKFLVVNSLLEQSRYLNTKLNELQHLDESVEKPPIDDWLTNDSPFILPAGYKKVDLFMTPKEERIFISFLYRETNGAEEVFLSKTETLEMFKHGFSLPPKDNIKYTLSLNKRTKTKKIIYYMIYNLYSKKKKTRFVKRKLAEFLKAYFTNFESNSLEDMVGAIRNDKKMPNFNIDTTIYISDESYS